MIMENARRVALLYDSAMMEHCTPPGHPENPTRLTDTIDILRATGVWDRIAHVPVVAATREQLLRVHDADYLSFVERIVARGGGYLDQGDTHASSGSWLAAALAAGAATGAVDACLSGQFDAAFALVRPPGHHALRASAMGFCILGNIAVAAAHAMEAHGARRVLIVDFDVHHGNGTQEMFEGDGRVLFFSVHQSPAYPFTGYEDEVGVGEGVGATVNVPLPAHVGDAGYERVFREILVPIAERFQPEVILVSAGYDAHWRNSQYVEGIAEDVTVAGFHRMSTILRDLADRACGRGRLVGILEGGYDHEALGYGVAATLMAWLGDGSAPDPIGVRPVGGPYARHPTSPGELDGMINRLRSMHHL